MISYLGRRALTTLVAIWGALTVVFLALNLSGNPVLLMVEPGASQAEIDRMTAALGYDQPVVIRYLVFLGQIVTGSLPDSLQYGRPVFQIVFERMPATVTLGLTALLIGVVIGMLVGYLAATTNSNLLQQSLMGLMALGQSVPTFYSAVLGIWIFAVTLRVLPTSGWTTNSALILPAVVLGIHTAPVIARVFRSSMVQTFHEDFVRTGRSKGLSHTALMVQHVVPNATLPLVTVIGLEAGSLLGGTVIVETIFAWPGVGRLAVTAIQNQDYPLVLATITVLILVFVVVNFVVDMLYSVLDPRARVSGRTS